MNHMTVNTSDAPWNQESDPRPYECAACYSILEEWEQDDPCILDGKALCDNCTSDLTLLRFDGVLSVATKTKALKQDILNRIAPIN